MTAYAALWNNYAGTDSDADDLGAGVNPQDIGGGPDAMWVMADATDPSPDSIGSVDLTLVNTPVQGGSDPTVSAPSGGQLMAAIAGPGGLAGPGGIAGRHGGIAGFEKVGRLWGRTKTIYRPRLVPVGIALQGT